MISIEEIRKDYPERLRSNPVFTEYMLKEYFHFKMLNIIYNSIWADQMIFIGGTSIRILHQVDRFSEDLDFDVRDLSRQGFMDMTDSIIHNLQQEGIEVMAKDREKDLQLNAFRRNMVFPELLHKLGLSGHREQRFLIKIESEPQHFQYVADAPIIQKFNIFTKIFAAPIDVLLSMKIAAALTRQKGRDYYDCIFLMGKTDPNWNFLREKLGIKNEKELKARFRESFRKVDFEKRSHDFEKLIFDKQEAKKVVLFPEYLESRKFNPHG